MEGYWAGIDLHSNNSVLCVLDRDGRIRYRRKLPNDLFAIVHALDSYREHLNGVAVESTYNWYWLADGLSDAGFRVLLANPAAMQQYDGLKFTNDESDAAWIANMLRLGCLPQGYIYPREQRQVRDLLRKRSQLVRQRTANILSIQNLSARNKGSSMRGDVVKHLTDERIAELFPDRLHAMAATANLHLVRALEEEIAKLECQIAGMLQPSREYTLLRDVAGIGKILAMTILLESGDIGRFASVGNYASYCRCVESKHTSNAKTKGHGNQKCGNKYLAWAFTEAANFAVRYHEPVQRFYHRKQAKRNKVVAIKAVAHKLARACYWVLKTGLPFDMKRAFG